MREWITARRWLRVAEELPCSLSRCARKARTASGVTWDEEALRAYLTSPQAFVSGTTMAFAGIADEEDVEGLVAYLRDAAR